MSKSLEILYSEYKQIKPHHIDAILSLLEEGNTIPFIARYRKEMTGSMDEVAIQAVSQRYNYLENLHKRKEDIIRLIDEQGQLTQDLENEILQATTLTKLEDLYRPYKPKKRTKASIAKEKGLQPLAMLIWAQEEYEKSMCLDYINPEFELESVEDVLLWTHEILAEHISDEAYFRDYLRYQLFNHAQFVSEVKDKDKDERFVYEMYYDFKQDLKTLQSHRILAMNRGEKEGILKLSILGDDEKILHHLMGLIKGNKINKEAQDLLELALNDAYKRFIKPAIERELRSELSAKAEHQAINIFGENLRNLLLQAPLKGKYILGFDPAYRTGCKLAIIDPYGKNLHVDVIYPHDPASQKQKEEAKNKFIRLIEKYKVDMVAIGNGTASRESERFVAEILKEIKRPVHFVIVNEAGASVYSASELARKEFPDLEVEKRSAISIARRLQDPLAELVKIDPKSVGVGQYQHDVSQKELNERLRFVVETAVNQVGVDVNTASVKLLEYVSGLSPVVAQNLVNKRDELGGFKSRKEIAKVPRLGPKALQQAIGFLRIPGAKDVLDNTGIHPESYDIVYKILKDYDIKEESLGNPEAISQVNELNLPELEAKYGLGHETLKDILDALKAPGRDIRESMDGPILRSDVLSMEDLKEGMELMGTVRNVVDFGAFVDIGVKQDGLVHISKLSPSFVKHPTDIVAVGDIVKVWVIGVDLQKGRIQLSMIQQG